MIYNDMKEKTVIITGGSMGIGKGCVKVFCKAEANVVFCSRNKETGLETEKEINDTTEGTCHFYQCDVTKPEEIKKMIEFTAEKFSHIDCIINNAGYTPTRRPIDDIDIEDFHELLKTNLISVFAGCKYALPYIRSTKGSIVNISSILGVVGQEGNSIYTATKGGIISLTKSLAIDEARNQVRVNAVLPGHIITEKYEMKMRTNPQVKKFPAGKLQWLSEGGLPEDVGYACLFLASSHSGYTTGSEIHVTGGFELGNGYRIARHDWTERMKFQV